MGKAGRRSLAEQLRQAIEDSGITMYKLSQDSGVNRSQLSRFMRGQRDLSLAVADKFCEVLGIGLSTQADALGLGPEKPRGRPRKAK
jgi:transcriptional regulator with XRE-family HTH domain